MVQTSYAYELYGAATASGATDSNALQYTSRDNDETGLYYYRNRYYSPVFGRFISADPVGLAGGQNSYAYVHGNPINTIDPTGLLPTCWDTPWGTKTEKRPWTQEREQSWYEYALRVGWPGVGDNLNPKSPGQMPIWPSSPLELWKVERGFTMTTTGVTTSVYDIIKVQCTDETTDECGRKHERYDSWEDSRVRSVNVKILSQSIESWMRWIERVVKIIDIPWP